MLAAPHICGEGVSIHVWWHVLTSRYSGVGGRRIRSSDNIHSEFEVSLDYRAPCLKKRKKKINLSVSDVSWGTELACTKNHRSLVSQWVIHLVVNMLEPKII